MAIARKKPTATGGSKQFPSLREDVRKGVKEDVDRIKKPRTSKARGAAKTAVQGAAKRAVGRMVSRAGLVGAAFSTGHRIGTAINKATGLSTKIANALSPSRNANPNVDVTGKPTRILMSRKIQKTDPTKKSDNLKKAQDFVKKGGVFVGASGKAKK